MTHIVKDQLANIWKKVDGNWLPVHKYKAKNIGYSDECLDGYFYPEYDCIRDDKYTVDKALCRDQVSLKKKLCLEYTGGNSGYRLWSKSGGGGWRTNRHNVKVKTVIGGWDGPGEYDVVLYWLFANHNYKSRYLMGCAKLTYQNTVRMFCGNPATGLGINHSTAGVFLCYFGDYTSNPPCPRQFKWDGTMSLPDSDGGWTSHWIKHLYTPMGTTSFSEKPKTLPLRADVYRRSHSNNDLSMVAYHYVLMNPRTMGDYVLPDPHYR